MGALAWAGCGAPELVSLGAAVPVTPTPTEAVPLEVVTRATAVRDPLPLGGEHVAFSGLEETLGHAISTAAIPWAQGHRAERPEGWQLTVELTRAEAARRAGRVRVVLGVRATLRARTDRRYLAQTQAHCREAQVAEPGEAAPIFYRCMMSVGRELVGWLGGVQP
jgi:hypothetical protein